MMMMAKEALEPEWSAVEEGEEEEEEEEEEKGGGGEDEGQYLTDVYLRDNFVASWLWKHVDLPRTPDGRDG